MYIYTHAYMHINVYIYIYVHAVVPLIFEKLNFPCIKV